MEPIFSAKEIEHMIRLQEEKVREDAIEFEKINQPYLSSLQFLKEAEDALELAREEVTDKKRLVFAAEDKLKESQDLLAKLSNYRAGGTLKEVTVMREKSHADSALKYPNTKQPKQTFDWQGTAVDVLQKAGKFLYSEELVDMILNSRPDYKQSFEAQPKSKQSSTKVNVKTSLVTAANKQYNPNNKTDKVLAYYKNKIGLFDWMLDNGEPEPKYILFKD